MNRMVWAAAVVVVWSALVLGRSPRPLGAGESTPVECVTQGPIAAEVLGTKLYEPSERERPFFEKLSPDEVKTGGLAGDYDLANKAGKYVGWFGVVREIEEDESGQTTAFTVEHKYFDGLTDGHIMSLSFNGAGDFRAVLSGTGHDIPLLTLVKVYGTVAKETRDGLPYIDAAFVRNWHWGTFTFMAPWGTQKGSEKWRKLNQVDLDQIYVPYPYPAYYEERLGKRDVRPARQRILKALGPARAEVQKALADLLGAVLAADDALAASALAEVRNRGSEKMAIRSLVACLGGDDFRVSNSAALLLREIGEPAVGPLVEALGDRKAGIRADAALGLYYLAHEAGDAVGPLTHALEDTDPRVRQWAARTLGCLRGDAQPALRQLTKMVDDPDSEVRFYAIMALWSVTLEPDPAVKLMGQIATSADDWTERCEAAEALGEMGAAEGVSALVEALKDEERHVRANAAAALGKIRPDPAVAVPPLIDAMQDEDHYVRSQAADSLGQMAPASIAALPPLIAALDDEDSFVRLCAVDAVASFGTKAAEAIPKLVATLEKDEDATVRGCVLKSLVKIDPEGTTCLPVLMKALEHSDPQTRRFAEKSLGDLGGPAKPALGKLTALLADPDQGVRVYAAGAVWKIDRRTDLAVPVLIDALKSGSPYERMWATWTIAQIGPDARAAAPALAENLTEPFPQSGAAKALCRIGPLPPDVVQALRQAMENEREDVGVWAARALWDVDHDPKLLEYLVDLAARWDFPDDPLDALAEIGLDAKMVVPALVDLLRHPKVDIRRKARETLERIDPSALEKTDASRP